MPAAESGSRESSNRSVLAPFDAQPRLTGELVELTPLVAEDFEALHAVASDPLIWEQHPASNRYEREVFRQFVDEALAGRGAFTVRDRATGQVIGSSRYHGFGDGADEVEIGWTFLARRCWGGRYNGEMKRLMLDHAFRFVSTVVFLIGPENIRSRRAVERIGGEHIGSRFDETGRESVVYRITREEWRSGRE